MTLHERNRPIGVGLVGYGLAGAVLHAPIIEALSDYRLVAVATSRWEAAARRDGPRVVPDIDALLQVPAVELVVIVTPNHNHAATAAKALEARRHVVIDKPMAPTVAECDMLIDLASQAGCLLSVYHNRRWDGDFLAASQEVARSRPALFAACWDRFRPVAESTWRNSNEPGAGLLWDLGSHMVDQAVQLFGWPDSMFADVQAQRSGARADDYFEIVLRYGSSRGVLSASSMIASVRPRFALHGSKGSWWTEGVDPVEAMLRRGASPFEPDAPVPSIPAFRSVTEGTCVAEPVPAGDPCAFYRKMAAAIRGADGVPVDPIDARNVAALIEAAHRGEAVPQLRPALREY